MSMYEVEKDVPLPEVVSSARSKAGRRAKYPFSHMSVGDSFKVPKADRNRVNAAAASHVKRHGGKFVTRKNGKGYRCWRLE